MICIFCENELKPRINPRYCYHKKIGDKLIITRYPCFWYCPKCGLVYYFEDQKKLIEEKNVN